MSIFVKSLFKYFFKRILGDIIDNDLNLDEVDFSAESFCLTDIEINKGIEIPNFKLISMTIKKVEIPWSVLKFNWSEIKLTGVNAILMPSPTFESNREETKEKTEEDANAKTTNYNSEESIGSAIVAKFLSSLGLLVKDVSIRILPHQFNVDTEEYDKLPTLMLRLMHLRVYKDSSRASENEQIDNNDDRKENDIDHENKLKQEKNSPPDILKIFKGKVLEIGQFSIHLLSSPFDTRSDQQQEDSHHIDFPFRFPPVNHLSTLLL